MKIVDMRVQNLSSPIGLTVNTPVLSYRLIRTQRAEKGKEYRQRAYRVLAGTSPVLLEADQADLWDSGVVESAEPFGIVYAGRSLGARQVVYWKVHVWMEDGTNVGWSPIEKWEMGIYPRDWQGMWIGQGDDYTGNKAAAPMFVKDFTINLQNIQHARLYISGLGMYMVSLNGRKLTDTLYDAGECDATETVYYGTYDVTGGLLQGENTLGVLLGNGQYTNFQYNPVMTYADGSLCPEHRYQKNDGGFVKPGIAGDKKLIAQLELIYEGGKRVLVVSDASWLWKDSPTIFQNWYGGEDYDALQEQEDWDLPVGNREGWKSCQTMMPPRGQLIGRDYPPIRIMERLPPKEIRRLANGNWLVDMGRNGAGFPEIRLTDTTQEQRGCWVKMYPAELVREDREGVDQASCTQSWNQRYQCAIVDSYRIKGTGEEVWHPRFCYQGFQYVEVAGYPGDLTKDHIQYCIVRTDNEKLGCIETSDEILNQISRMVERSMESNMFGSFTDCPQIEKLGWIETSHLMFAALAGTYDIRGWMNKILRDIIDAQVDVDQAEMPGNEPKGYVPGIIPEYQRIIGLHLDPNWNGACVFTPWEYFKYYGEREVLRRAYPEMMEYLRYLQGYVRQDVLEGYAQMGEWGEFGEKTPTTLVATCSYYRMLRIVSRVAELLGEGEVYLQLRERAERTQVAFHCHPECYNAETGVYGTGSQASYGCVLYSGLVPAENRKRTADLLVEAVQRRNYHLSSGEVGLKQVFQALAQNGRNDVVYRMIMHKQAPSYRYFVEKGYTTLPEYWNCDELWHGMARSRNHAMMGHVKEWMGSYLLGVRPRCPGYTEVEICPWMPEGMMHLEGSVPTPYGIVKVRCYREAGDVKVETELPVGVKAVVK